MKTKLFIAIAIAAFSAPSFAQRPADKSTEPKVGKRLPPLDNLSLRLQLQNDPKLPALPKLSATDPAGIKIRTLETYRGRIFQLEIVRKNHVDVLSSIVAAMGQQSVFDPSISKTVYQTAVFRAYTLEDLLRDVCDPWMDAWKSSSGTFFFADKAEVVEQKKRLDEMFQPVPTDPNADPFIIPRGTPETPQPKSKFNELPFDKKGRI